MPQLALFCDNDSIPGTHCPLNEVGKREEDSKVVMAIRGRTSYHLNLKEVRPMNLVRMRVHYVNVNEKSLLRLMKSQFKIKTGVEEKDLSVSVTNRSLNVRMNNTWVDIGQRRSVNLTAPVKTSQERQILEACANIKIEQVLMDPMICMLFEVVLEVRVSTKD